MNWSSEPVRPAAGIASVSISGFASGAAASYVPMQYREAAEPACAEAAERAAEASMAAAPAAEPAPNLDELLAERIEQERRTLREQARKEAEREIERASAAIRGALEQFAQQAEGEIVNLALAIARRILRRESQIDPQLLAGLVRHELEHVESATSVRLVVSPESLKYWSEALRGISRPVELAEDKSVESGAARIETALGSTTVGFEVELKEIERSFFDLLARRPAMADREAVHVQ